MIWGSLFSVASLKIMGLWGHTLQLGRNSSLIAAWILFSEVTCVSNIKCQGSGPDYLVVAFIYMISYSVVFLCMEAFQNTTSVNYL